MTISQLSLVDLAGSERTKRTENPGIHGTAQSTRRQEAGNINNSLMALRECLRILRENQKNSTNRIVPYRNSRLTYLLKNCFDGEGKVRMIVCVNPAVEDYDETMHVMDFAEMTQEVQVLRQNPSKPDIAFTPGRRKANQLFKKTVEETHETKIKELDLGPIVMLNLMSGFPNLLLTDPDDEEILPRLIYYLEQRIAVKTEAIEELETYEENFRRELMRSGSGESALINGYEEEIKEKNRILDQYQETIKEKDMVISQCKRDMQKVKEKCVNTIEAAKEKLKEEMKMKITKMKDDNQVILGCRILKYTNPA